MHLPAWMILPAPSSLGEDRGRELLTCPGSLYPRPPSTHSCNQHTLHSSGPTVSTSWGAPPGPPSACPSPIHPPRYTVWEAFPPSHPGTKRDLSS